MSEQSGGIIKWFQGLSVFWKIAIIWGIWLLAKISNNGLEVGYILTSIIGTFMVSGVILLFTRKKEDS